MTSSDRRGSRLLHMLRYGPHRLDVGVAHPYRHSGSCRLPDGGARPREYSITVALAHNELNLYRHPL
jgi:hypothetical protein